MVLTPGQPIPYGRPYRYHLNGPVHMMTVRKRVGPMPTHRLAMRHSVDYSSSDHFSSDNSSRDSSSESSLNSSMDALYDSASSRSSSDHSLPAPSSESRSLSISYHIFTSLGPLSYARADLLSSPKRIRSPETATDLEGCSEGYRGNGLWEMVRGELGDVLGWWFGKKTVGEGGLRFGGKVGKVGFVCTMAEIGCNWARIGPSKSSQSLSIAHKWAVEID
ncbi:hypothetical protein Tco_0105492 [Tanacetum coccineum]